ncbi:L-aspartate oxidase [Coxiella endosymbiont of Amblyomma americanum]|uniref:L-aspartate oxidase n=1 Tax=Coxiella endosymbiont of Amblyomma americanum TaxID=325775 RepID=UPI0005808E28|nr:L-aspartate oxidase [Coxiella endosymbiont of Amblyomma americanum]AJC50384.1 L-aspartate oxidase [Coxiella endosymbiont of Amblyomma americanum]AUJ58726.1 L-aspartate oxidase [Coxiella-like endosymbiont of Amblyomma americanum]
MPIYDVLIIGSGIAGLGLAVNLANKARIAILSKEEIIAEGSSSAQAQGGIAAVMGTISNDSVELHMQDTLNAGCGLCDPITVRTTVSQAKLIIEWLIQKGVQFTGDSKEKYHLTQEGGHSQRRILHVADKTGEVVVNTLVEQAIIHPNIDFFTNHIAVDLLIKNKICRGALVYDIKKHSYLAFTAYCTVLATGGASSIYLHTSNSSCISGDGIAMAWRAGCRIANLEFNQFHPTCLYYPSSNHYLISEVVRGEGGYLLLPNGKRFMLNYDKRAEMAPRDIVSRAIHAELQKNKLNFIYLDISHRHASFIKRTFPTIYTTCLKFGLDMTKEPLPVVPAAHYTCGGIITDLSGKTDIPNLYAIGEVAFTGLHGANRIASNSLLECLVFASNSAKSILEALRVASDASQNNIQTSFLTINHTATVPIITQSSCSDFLIRIQKIMWDYVGIVRTNKGLNYAKQQLQEMTQQINTLFLKPTKSSIELRNIIAIAGMVIQSALLRKESRGLHYNKDYPQTDLYATKNTILIPPNVESNFKAHKIEKIS